VTTFDYRDWENDSRAKASLRMNVGHPECQKILRWMNHTIFDDSINWSIYLPSNGMRRWLQPVTLKWFGRQKYLPIYSRYWRDWIKPRKPHDIIVPVEIRIDNLPNKLRSITACISLLVTKVSRREAYLTAPILSWKSSWWICRVEEFIRYEDRRISLKNLWTFGAVGAIY
jgi:hypothetical protein